MADVVSLLRELVAIPSVNPSEGEPDEIHGESRMIAYLADWCRARKLDFELQEVQPGRQNLIARVAGGKGPSVVFEAHLDTVEIANMEIAPFDPVLRDGRVYGRGSCDCKGSLAAMMVALEQVMGKGTPPGEIILAATADEEAHFGGVKRLVETGFRADGAVVGEPTSLELIVAHKGALRVKIACGGRAAHSSDPSKGENAIYHMGRVLEAVQAYGRQLTDRPRHALVGGPTVSVGLISGGMAVNIVPDRCEIAVDRRVTPLETVEQVEAELRAWLAEHLEGVPWEMSVMLADGALEGSSDSGIARRCALALDRALGSHTVGGVQYGTDASKFAAAGTPAVVLGPGSIAQAHTAVEWVEVAQVEQAVEVYREIMWGAD
ncbi:MAG: M20 family metallopeptidase [Armatimonadota bacterium]